MLNIGAGIPHDILEMGAMSRICGNDAVHQGVILYCDPLPQPNLGNLLKHLAKNKGAHTLLILDNLTDPQNIGAIVRTCAAFGVKGIICHDRQTPATETPSLVKAACGALEYVPITRVGNIAATQETLKENGYWCLGLSEHAQTTLDKVPTYEKLAVVMGSEGKGIRPQVLKNCDITARIATNPNFPTLNVSVATAVTLSTLTLGHK